MQTLQNFTLNTVHCLRYITDKWCFQNRSYSLFQVIMHDLLVSLLRLEVTVGLKTRIF